MISFSCFWHCRSLSSHHQQAGGRGSFTTFFVTSWSFPVSSLIFPRMFGTLVYWSDVVCDDLRYHSYGAFLVKSEDVGYYHLVVYLGSYCPSLGTRPYIRKSSSSSVSGFLSNVSCFCNAIGYAYYILWSLWLRCSILFVWFLRYHGFQLLGTGFSIILLNLGKRQPGDVRLVFTAIQIPFTAIQIYTLWLRKFPW